MRRVAAALVLMSAIAACGGRGDTRPRVVERPAGAHAVVHAVVHGEVRSPDARSPFVTAAGFWRCPTSGRIDLRISSDAQATLSSGGQPLASASLGRALVNRTCERRRVAPRPPIDAPRGTRGAASLRCQVPSSVLVGFSDGDLVVHGTHDGRFLAGAAVGYARVDVAGYWTAACAPY